MIDPRHRAGPWSGTRRLACAGSLFLLLSLASCTCSHRPAASVDAPSKDTAPKVSDTPAHASDAAEAAASAEQARQDARMSEAASLVHAYLGALAAGDLARADASWRNGHPPPVADDALLRNLPGLQSIKIRNTTPVPLDKALPTQAVEVPVTLRVASPQGQVRNYDARYRLARTLDDSGWEISSASVYARMD